MPWQPNTQAAPAQNGFSTPRPGGGNFDSSGRKQQGFQNRDQGGHRQETVDVYVSNIPVDMTQDQLQAIFCEAGDVHNVNVLQVKEGRDKTIGFVKYLTAEEATRAVQQFHGYAAGDSQLSVRFAKGKGGGAQQQGQMNGFAGHNTHDEQQNLSPLGAGRGSQPFSQPPMQQNAYQMNGFNQNAHETQRNTFNTPVGRGSPQPQWSNDGFSHGMGRGYQQNQAGTSASHRSPDPAPFTGTVQRSTFQPRSTPPSSGMGRGSVFQNSAVSPSGTNRNWSSPNAQPEERGRGCHHCGQEGHIARECPMRSADKGGSGGSACHHCGQEGHFARECPEKSSGSGGACHHCGQDGHFARECPEKSSGGGGACHHCGQQGHFARECPEKGSAGGKGCHHCGQEGHFARECPEKGSGGGGACHHCGQQGHFARECPMRSPERGSGGGGACHRCGQEGHFARECPEGDSAGGDGCHRCGQEGHLARECPNPPEDGRPPPVTYVPPEQPDAEEMFSQMDNLGINFDQYDSIPVDVTGRDPIPGIQHFEDAGLYEVCARNVKRANYIKPTPVQKRAIPIILRGRDLMACAQTGSGKTAAFLLPVMTHMLNQGLGGTSMLSGGPQKPLALIIAPTRELVLQIYNEVRKFCDGSIIRPVVCYGGVSVSYQLSDLSKGCHILVATPGRLCDFVTRGRVSFELVRYLILDEADRMLDMGFEPAVRKMIEQMDMPEKTRRQTLMFSATFPEEIQRLAGDFLNDYLFLTVGRVGGSNTDIEQIVLQVAAEQKREKLVELLTQSGSERTLIFVERKRASDFLASFLSQNDFPSTSISGDRDQREREAALVDFKNGRAPFLVATAVAARGLDIANVKHVINFDLPMEIDEYVHRIGRTGRIGKHGKATSFFDMERDTKLARSLVKVLADASQAVPAWLEDTAMSAVGSSYGPAGGRFGARDRRERAPPRSSPGAPPVQQNISQQNGLMSQQNGQSADDDEDWD